MNPMTILILLDIVLMVVLIGMVVWMAGECDEDDDDESL